MDNTTQTPTKPTKLKSVMCGLTPPRPSQQNLNTAMPKATPRRDPTQRITRALLKAPHSLG